MTCVLLAATAELPPPPVTELITNLAQISRSAATNLPPLRLVAVRLQGTVVIGGNSDGVAVLDGSPVFCFLPATSQLRLDRGRRIQIEGHCLLDGTSFLLESRPLVENDGLHLMYAK